MIGNDVVDLALAKVENNWMRKGYLDKVFTTEEQLSISRVADKDNRVWDLWTRKEAAYKIYNRQTKIRCYIPLELECFDLATIDRTSYGKVICRGNVYYTRTEISSDRIDTIAVVDLGHFDKIQYLTNNTVVQKELTIPSYYNNSVLKPLSISHHGRFESIVALF